MRRPWPIIGGVVSCVAILAVVTWVIVQRSCNHSSASAPTTTQTPSVETCDALAVMEAEAAVFRSALRERFTDVSQLKPDTPAGWAALMRAEAICDGDRMLAEDTTRYVAAMGIADFDHSSLFDHSCGGGRPMEPASDSEQDWSTFVAQSRKLITLLDSGEHDWRESIERCYKLANSEPRHVSIEGFPAAVRN